MSSVELQIKFMKKLLLFFGMVIAAGCSLAQNKPIPANIPPYHILTPDSVYVTPINLKKGKPVLIIYFSPDCSHCQHMMYELKPKMKDLKNTQVIMITFVQQIQAIRNFVRDFDLKKYPNFIVGTEGYTMVVQRFYDVHTTPFTALYDKNQKLVKSWDKAPTVDELTNEVKKL
jgi:thiol-disulfide isomerase/thioredoxin